MLGWCGVEIIRLVSENRSCTAIRTSHLQEAEEVDDLLVVSVNQHQNPLPRRPSLPQHRHQTPAAHHWLYSLMNH